MPRVTTLVRTLADYLRTLHPRDGLAMLDAAIRDHALTTQDLNIALYRERGWPGIVQARRVAALGCGRRETPLESWSAWTFHHLGVPAPRWQVEIRTPRMHFVARADGWWPEGVVGESDGRVKYLLGAAERGGADAQNLAEVLHAEREREHRLRRLGATVVRWGDADLVQIQRAEGAGGAPAP